jgi:hypothetical protein
MRVLACKSQCVSHMTAYCMRGSSHTCTQQLLLCSILQLATDTVRLKLALRDDSVQHSTAALYCTSIKRVALQPAVYAECAVLGINNVLIGLNAELAVISED